MPRDRARSQYPVTRAVLCLKLRRVTTRDTEGESELRVILTTFRQGTAEADNRLAQKARTEAWKAMLDVICEEGMSKWMIAGSLATHEIQLAVNLNQTKNSVNPTSVFSRDKVVACVAQGVHLESCENHDVKQVLVLEIEGKRMSDQEEAQGSGENTHAAQEIHERQGDKLRLTSFYDCFTRAVKQTKDDSMDNLVPLLYAPRRQFRWAEDGALLLQAPTQFERSVVTSQDS